MKNITLFLIVTMGLMLFACGKDDTTDPNRLQFGDIHEGGYIFYLDETGEHGKVCDEENLGTFDWDGAVAECEASNKGGYTDWYLPSKDELKMMYTNLHENKFGGFITSSYYWSSTEVNDLYAVVQNFNNGAQGYNFRFEIIYVRAVRAF